MTTEHIELTSSTTIANLSLRTIEINGSIALTANPYILANNVVALCDTTTFGNVFIRLQLGTYKDGITLVSNQNQYNIIKNTGSGTVTITPAAGFTINGTGSYVLAAGNMIKLLLDQTLVAGIPINNWVIIAFGAVVTPGSKIPSIASSTTNAIVRWSGALGDTFNNSLVTIDNSNNITIPVALNITGSLFTGTAALSAATNTVIGTVTGTAPNNTSLLMGNSINGALTTLVGSMIAIGNNVAGNRLAALTNSTDSIIMTHTGLSSVTAITNSVVWAAQTNFAGAIADALIIGAGTTDLTLTAVGSRVILMGNIAASSPTAIGDDTIYFRTGSTTGNRPSLRSISLGRGGLIDKSHTAATADIIYMVSTSSQTTGTTTDNRVIAVGTTTNSLQNSTDCVVCAAGTVMGYETSSNCAYVMASTSSSNATNSDCVLIGKHISINLCVRSVLFKKATSLNIISSLINVTDMTPEPAYAVDVTKAGVLVMSSMEAAAVNNTGFGYTVATALTSGVDNALVGTNITSAGNTATSVALGTTLTVASGVERSIAIGNDLVMSGAGANKNIIAIGAGTITAISNRLFLGTATNTINVTTTIGAAGAAAAPVAPAQYMRVLINGVAYRVPLFNQA
jgi:hypothetical protein